MATVETPSIPAGKVSCLLCGGFISVQGGDRARFVDHMTNEHDANNVSHDVLLALCVMDNKEKGFLVKSSSARLEEIGRGHSPNYSQSFINKLTQTPTPVQGLTAPPTRPPPPALTFNRGRGRGGQIRQPRPAVQQPTPRSVTAPPKLMNMPSVLQSNGSISISKVDQRKKCTMCSDTLPNHTALVEHMNRNHMNVLCGIKLASPSIHGEDKKYENIQRSAKEELKVQSPNAYLNLKQPGGYQPRTGVMNSSRMPMKSPANGTPRPRPPMTQPRGLVNSNQRKVAPRSPFTQNIQKRQSADVGRCNICMKSVEKSKLAVHKLSHSEDRKNEKSSLIRTNIVNKVESIKRAEKINDNQEVEMIELDMDDTEVSKSPKFVEEVECKVCNKKLASNMALKMHNNLKHPVKKEVDDVEMLLGEEIDNVKEKDDVKNEIDKMETLELLDNLVNFLNDS